jgi:hypothetical protein
MKQEITFFFVIKHLQSVEFAWYDYIVEQIK